MITALAMLLCATGQQVGTTSPKNTVDVWSGTAPSGACSGVRQVKIPGGALYYCNAGTWALETSVVSPGTDISATVSKSGATGAITRSLAARLGDVANVMDFGATGSSLWTYGAINSGATALTLTNARDFAAGQHIVITGAGAAGGLLTTTISTINGTAVTVANAASTTVAAGQVWHDDTAAIQAAINSFPSGGPVFLPSGYYKITATLTFRALTTMEGVGSQDLVGSYTGGGVGTVIDCKLITTYGMHAIDMGAGGEGATTAVRNLSLSGEPTSAGCGFGIKMGRLIDNVYINGTCQGISANATRHAVISNTVVNNPRMFGVLVSNSAWDTRIWQSSIANAGSNGSGAVANIGIDGAYSTIVDTTLIDEAFGTGVATVKISNSSDHTTIRDSVIYGVDAPAGQGYGIYVDSTSTHVNVVNVKVQPYSAAAMLNTIYLRGSGHTLQNVQTAPVGGGDISDGTTDATYYWNVNGGCNSTASPGAATCNGTPGRAAIAAGQSSVVITNNLVKTISRVHATLQTVDGTCSAIKAVVPAAGSFTLYANANCTGTTNFAWELN